MTRSPSNRTQSDNILHNQDKSENGRLSSLLLAVSPNWEQQHHQHEQGYLSRASPAPETACKMKIHQQPPPDRHQKMPLPVQIFEPLPELRFEFWNQLSIADNGTDQLTPMRDTESENRYRSFWNYDNKTTVGIRITYITMSISTQSMPSNEAAYKHS